MSERKITKFFKPERSSLRKVISGGQCGADFAGLQAARDTSIDTGGVAPPGFVTSRGKKPELGTVFGLREFEPLVAHTMNARALYAQRSMQNVDESDGTVAFRLQPSIGTDRTIAYCRTGKWGAHSGADRLYRNCLVIEDLHKDNHEIVVQQIRNFIESNFIRVLNVAGHRNDETAGMQDFGDAVRLVLTKAFRETLKI